MTVVSAAVFAHRFRALGTVERHRFISALWEAKGFEIEQTAGRIIAHGDDGSRYVITVGKAIPASDVVIAPKHRIDRERNPSLVAFSVEDLYQFLLYGIDRSAAEFIASEHLELTLVGETQEDQNTFRGNASRVPTMAGILVLMGVLVVVVSSGMVFDDGGPTEIVPADRVDADPLGAEIDQDVPRGGSIPPGITISGVSNPNALVLNHRRLLSGQSHSAIVRYSGPPGSSVHGDASNFSMSLIAVNNSHFVRTENRTRFDELRDETVNISREEVHLDHEVYLRSIRTNESGVIRDEIYSVHPTMRVPYPAPTTTEWILRNYRQAMSAPITTVDVIFFTEDHNQIIAMDGRTGTHPMPTNESEFATIDAHNETVYRISAVGTPSEYDDEMIDVRATAFLTDNGRLITLSIEFVEPDSNRQATIEVTYADVGNLSSIDHPSWYRSMDEEAG